ncbi:hypothetical protein [Paenibacillus sp. GCM10012306]|uniref:hypothetical protein n=1 Tax=Paenibacillus sp. GCM10012306 TaxID=3317342 RepID=UPI003616C6B7
MNNKRGSLRLYFRRTPVGEQGVKKGSKSIQQVSKGVGEGEYGHSRRVRAWSGRGTDTIEYIQQGSERMHQVGKS